MLCFSFCVFSQKYRYQDEDTPHDHSLPRLTHEVRGPELVHVSEKNLSQIENVHGYVLQSHISPLKVSSIALRAGGRGWYALLREMSAGLSGALLQHYSGTWLPKGLSVAWRFTWNS